MRVELRQIFQTGVKDKHGNDVNDSHPLLSAERGSRRPGSCPGSRPAPAAGLRWLSPCSGDCRFGKCPYVLVSFLFLFVSFCI